MCVCEDACVRGCVCVCRIHRSKAWQAALDFHSPMQHALHRHIFAAVPVYLPAMQRAPLVCVDRGIMRGGVRCLRLFSALHVNIVLAACQCDLGAARPASMMWFSCLILLS